MPRVKEIDGMCRAIVEEGSMGEGVLWDVKTKKQKSKTLQLASLAHFEAQLYGFAKFLKSSFSFYLL